MCARSEFPSSWSWGCFAFTHRIIPVHLIIFFKWQMHKGWDCLKWGSAVEVFRKLARLLPALSFLIYLVIKKNFKALPQKNRIRVFCLYIQGKAVFPLVKETSPGSYCFEYWLETVSSKRQTHSRVTIILISQLCFLFPLNHSPSRSLWSLVALPSLNPVLSTPSPSQSFIACLSMSLLSGPCRWSVHIILHLFPSQAYWSLWGIIKQKPETRPWRYLGRWCWVH